MEAQSSPGRIENLTGVACDEIEREFGSMHSFKHGNLCNRCQSRVNPAQMVPLHDVRQRSDDVSQYIIDMSKQFGSQQA